MHCQFCGAALESLPVRCPFCAAQPVLGERYQIDAIIGRGGMGEVFLAHDRRLDNDVAIKRLTPQLASSEELRESLRREARIMARLSDSSIVRLFDLAEFYGDFYLILEYVPGPTLRDMIRAGYRASVQELAKVMYEVCQGLTVAHNAGVIHRDLKPSNLLLGLKGDELQAYLKNKQLPRSLANAKVKITDFGIAKAIADSRLTITNAFSGTPGYMAPEQFRGEIPSPQTDVYALGVLAYELLTGKMPEPAMANIMSVPPALSDVIRMAMSPAREKRFPSAAAFYEALYNGIEGRSPVRPLVPGLSTGAKLGIAGGFSFLAVLIAVIVALNEREAPIQAHRSVRPPNYKPLLMPHPPAPLDWHPFPKVAELPRVVEEARGKLAAAQLAGPRNAKIKWEIELSDLHADVAAVGIDGTVYLTNQGTICAVRDGRLLWAFQNTEFSASIQGFEIDSDGRIWLKVFVMGEYQYYCLNRDGEGGRLPRSFENRLPKFADSAPYSCWKNKHTLSGPEGDLDLPDDCKHVALGREGRVWVATDLPEILAVSKQGQFEFKYKPSCEPSALVPTLANRLAFPCPDNSLHQLNRDAEIWNRGTDGAIASIKSDTEGTLFFSDAEKSGKTGHIHAVDAQGNPLWTVNLSHGPDGAIVFGPKRQLYVFQPGHEFGAASRLLQFAD